MNVFYIYALFDRYMWQTTLIYHFHTAISHNLQAARNSIVILHNRIIWLSLPPPRLSNWHSLQHRLLNLKRVHFLHHYFLHCRCGSLHDVTSAVRDKSTCWISLHEEVTVVNNISTIRNTSTSKLHKVIKACCEVEINRTRIISLRPWRKLQLFCYHTPCAVINERIDYFKRCSSSCVCRYFSPLHVHLCLS